jgi:hypothetical protein
VSEVLGSHFAPLHRRAIRVMTVSVSVSVSVAGSEGVGVQVVQAARSHCCQSQKHIHEAHNCLLSVAVCCAELLPTGFSTVCIMFVMILKDYCDHFYYDHIKAIRR